jgi:hypothetical protein
VSTASRHVLAGAVYLLQGCDRKAQNWRWYQCCVSSLVTMASLAATNNRSPAASGAPWPLELMLRCSVVVVRPDQ